MCVLELVQTHFDLLYYLVEVNGDVKPSFHCDSSMTWCPLISLLAISQATYQHLLAKYTSMKFTYKYSLTLM